LTSALMVDGQKLTSQLEAESGTQFAKEYTPNL
jgi:hypothetical protein